MESFLKEATSFCCCKKATKEELFLRRTKRVENKKTWNGKLD
jgi:hypothetical protein